jgi:hypothetical protein
MPVEQRLSADAAGDSRPGPFLAKVVSHLDPTYMGSLEVQLLREVGNDEDKEGQLRVVKYLSPFYGVTSVDYVGSETDDYNNTQKSYGMWMVPPDVGTIVLCLFVDGDPKKGYWIGCVPDTNMNFMMPGYAATKFVVEDTKESLKERIPVGEYNKVIQDVALDPTKLPKPEHPFTKVLDQQGLLEDDIRGITSSSARREVPSAVFGISTPGPVDKQPESKKGKIGKSEHKIANAFVSRLGGSSFVMDDGDDKFLRKTPATEGPPDYAAVEQDQDDGNVTIPHNELIRLRTRTGHQILLHNSEDLIYIGNSRGTSWIELSSDGKIDIYAEDSISIRTKQDFNFYADRDINFEAGRNINLKSAERFQTDVGADYNLVVKGDGKITTVGGLDVATGGDNNLTAGGDTNIKSGGNHVETASRIDMNGPAAATATPAVFLSTHDLEDIVEDAESETLSYIIAEEPIKTIVKRMPTHEPWPHHENLDPLAVKPEKTDRETSEAIAVPDYWAFYTTNTDTFEKLKGPEEEEQQE